MTVDVAVVGAPFLDVTFEGMPHLPLPGQEVVGRALHLTPGGTGLQAVAVARLGMSVVLVAPLGSDAAGRLLRACFHAEGVRVIDGGRTGDTPVSALLSAPEGVAVATVQGSGEPDPADVRDARATAVVGSLGRLHLMPGGHAVYAVTGALELGGIDRATLARLARARAFVSNAAEATAISGLDDPEAAARHLAALGPTAVVTLGSDGAVAAEGDGVVHVAAPEVPVADATGAGDAFVPAYLWADLRKMRLRDRLEWATLYASLSVRAPTALAGAVRLQELLREGAARGLTPP